MSQSVLPHLELEPGRQEPYAPHSADGIAELFGVGVERVADWLDQGLEQDRNGLIDVFSCCNWLSWGRLDEVPVLARRWRSFLRWFEPFVAGRDRQRRVRWRRRHRLFLPDLAVPTLDWYLPDPHEHGERQRVLAVTPLRCGGIAAERHAREGYQRLRLVQPEETPECEGLAEVVLAPQRVLDQGEAEHATLLRLLEDHVAEFRYLYRRHVHADDVTTAAAWFPFGTCLDCALGLGARLAESGRRWRLCGGIVCSDAIANPHYWIEVEAAGGRRVPLDPSLPAIARMLGADWRAWARAYTGGCDARRITLALGPNPLAERLERAFVSLVPGEAVATRRVGSTSCAWPCIDWVCGWTGGTFEPV